MLITDQIKSWIEQSCEQNGNRYSADDCIGEIERGEKRLWSCEKGMMIAGIIDYPQYRIAFIDSCAGQDFDSWGSAMLNQIELWAEDNECHQIIIAARSGFKKFLKARGFNAPQLLFEKVL